MQSKLKLASLITIVCLILPLLFIIIPTSPVSAANVWYVATTGDDTTGDGSSGNPWKTIGKALTSATDGDTINVAAGTYNERITLQDGVKVLGAGAGVTTIDGGAGGSVVTATSVTSATRLDGFTVTNGSAAYGGGMQNNNSSPIVTNCTFSGNSATYGGGMYNYQSSPTVTNCTFSGNSATYFGGGMCNDNSSSPTVTNCTFSGNTATYPGGGMFNYNYSSPTVTNCILWDDGQEIDNPVYSSPVVTYCDIQGAGIYPGTGNINADPLFVIPGTGDFHLQGTSPCIDVGSNEALYLPSTDFEGDPRIIDGNSDGSTVVDMGVDEYMPADLSIIKSGNPDPVIAGTDITYNLTVTNNGPSDATGVTVSDPLPAGVTFKSADTHGKGTFNSVTGNWTGFNLTDEESATLDLVVTVDSPIPSGTILSNTASVSYPDDHNSENNRATAETAVITSADLAITKTDDPDPVIAGTDLTWNLTVTNNGPSDATGVIVSDPLPAGVTFKSADTHGKGTFNSVTGNWTGFNLTDEESATLDLVVTVNSPAEDGTLITNQALVSSNMTDPDTNNNSASQVTTVLAPAVADPKKVELANDADGNWVASPGDTLKYTNQIDNAGSGTAFGVIFSDTPDPNTTLVAGSVKTTKGAVSEGNNSGDIKVKVLIGDLPAHSDATVTFNVTINDPIFVQQVANQAVTTGTNFSEVKSNDPDTEQPNDPTITQVKTSAPRGVGGEVKGVDKFNLIIPWLVLGAVVMASGTILMRRRARR